MTTHPETPNTLSLHRWLAAQLKEEIFINLAEGSFNRGSRVTFRWISNSNEILPTEWLAIVAKVEDRLDPIDWSQYGMLLKEQCHASGRPIYLAYWLQRATALRATLARKEGE